MTMGEDRTSPVSIGVLDNDVLAAQALCLSIERLDPTFTVAWWARSATRVLHRCLREPHPPDVLVTDMALNDMPGPLVCETMRRATPAIGIVAVTAYPCESYEADAAAAGAQAILPKEATGASMIRAIRRAAQGLPTPDDGMFMDAAWAHELLAHEPARSVALTPMERAVMRCLSEGESVDSICEHYGVSRSTVYTHTHRVVDKLRVRNRAEAVAVCRRWHLLEAGL